MSAAGSSELARSLDESLAKILDTEALLEAASADRLVEEATNEAIRGLGVHAVCVGEEVGGLGLPLAERLRLAAVFGRRLVPAAIRDESFGVVPGLASIASAGAPAVVTDLLSRAVEGELRAAVAVERRLPDAVRGEPGLLSPSAVGCELLVVLGSESVELFRLGPGGASAEPVEALDAGQGMARIELDGAEPLAVLSGCDARRLRREHELALVCEAFGVGERALEMSVSYAEQREQFGRPIASFQALAHLLAEMKLGIEICRAGIGRYVDLDGSGAEGATEAALQDCAATLAHTVPAAARRACEGAIHVHGGIGFSWELGLHLSYRRVLSVQYELGGEAATAQRVGAEYLSRRSAI